MRPQRTVLITVSLKFIAFKIKTVYTCTWRATQGNLAPYTTHTHTHCICTCSSSLLHKKRAAKEVKGQEEEEDDVDDQETVCKRLSFLFRHAQSERIKTLGKDPGAHEEQEDEKEERRNTVKCWRLSRDREEIERRKGRKKYKKREREHLVGLAWFGLPFLLPEVHV